MASGRMEFHANSIMQHANFTFVLPVDMPEDEIKNKQYYERPPKSLILLHGLTGTDTDWLFGGVAQYMSMQYNLAIFMPTTGNSFYLDRGYEGGNFATFVGEELPEFINRTFGYCESRENTMIGGLSMGGYGSIHTALTFPERFSKCIALSSALRIHLLAKDPKGDGVIPPQMARDIFGDLENIESSEKNPEVLYRKLKESGNEIPEMYLACGTEDSLLESNREFVKFLEDENADFAYEEGPGIHDWVFWNQYLDRGLQWALQDD